MFFAGFGAFALIVGRLCVRWHDAGIAAVCSSCAGILTAGGLSVLRSPQLSALPGFVLILLLVLMTNESSLVSCSWKTEWTERLRQLLPPCIAAALLAGLTVQPVVLFPVVCVPALLSRLAWQPLRAAIRWALALLLAAALGFSGSVFLSPWMGWIQGLFCGICLGTAVFAMLPLACRLYPSRQNRILFCLFVFLTTYYTNCII
jgi:uncharacterized membrane protein YfcA